MHFAISLLESSSGRDTLIETGIKVWNNWNLRMQRDQVFKGDVNRHPELMEKAVDKFLGNIRADPPNIIVSTRVVGEGVVQRLNWSNPKVSKEFEVKWGVIYRLNKWIIDDAIEAAEAGYIEEFRRFLFLMGMAAAHELVHAFVSVLSGNNRAITPAPVNYPRPGEQGSRAQGESGRYFEGALAGFVVEAWYNAQSPLGARQPGDLICAVRNPSTSAGISYHELDERWMSDLLSLNFSSSHFPAPTRRWRLYRLSNSSKSMEQKRRDPEGDDFDDRDLGNFLTHINTETGTVRVGSGELRHIMGMAFRLQNIKGHA